jgi:hypothetical protein
MPVLLGIQQNILDFIDVSPYALDASLRCFQLLVQSLDRHSRRIVQFMLGFSAHMLLSSSSAYGQPRFPLAPVRHPIVRRLARRREVPARRAHHAVTASDQTIVESVNRATTSTSCGHSRTIDPFGWSDDVRPL